MKAKVFHAELWGLREEKYSWLLKKDIKKTKWKRLYPKSEFYLFIPRDERLLKHYQNFEKITEIFNINSVGIVTARDSFVTDFERNKLKTRILQLRNKNISDEIIRQTYNLQDKSNWKLSKVREILINDFEWEKSFQKILYRPFDLRHIFYNNLLVERSREDVMRHMTKKNIGLITIRRSRSLQDWNYAFIANTIVAGATAITSLDINYLFPLYLYEGSKKSNSKKKNPLALATTLLIAEPEAEYYVTKPNFTKAFEDMISKLYTKPPTPEEIFYYIYGVLYSNTYRTRYVEFLKIDFPRVPFTKDYELFKKMSEYGNRLADLHLLKSQELNTPIAQFKIEGSNKVQKVIYDAGRVYINNEQYFEVVPEEIWNYQIGGYKVCDKWLKDRKERILSLDETQTYCRIITAISKTIEIQGLIDEIYDELEMKS